MANSNTANNQVNAEVSVKQAIANIDKKKVDLGQLPDLTESTKGGGSKGNATNVFDHNKASNINWPPIPACAYWGYQHLCIENGLTSGKDGFTDSEIEKVIIIKQEAERNSKGNETGRTFYTYKNLKTGKTYKSVQRLNKHLTASGYAKRMNEVLTRS
jgi:hypothetical protein